MWRKTLFAFMTVVVGCCAGARVAQAEYYASLDFEPLTNGYQNIFLNASNYLRDAYPYGTTVPTGLTFAYVSAPGSVTPALVERITPDGGMRALRIAIGPTPAGQIKDRSEYKLKIDITNDRDYYLNYDVFIPSTEAEPFPTGWFMMTQVWQDGSQPPPLSISLYNGKDASGAIVPMIGVIGRNEIKASLPVISTPVASYLNRWVNVGLRFRMGASGYAELTLDGNKIGEAPYQFNWSTVCPNYSCSDKYVLKFGIYRGASAYPTHLDFDNISLYDTLPVSNGLLKVENNKLMPDSEFGLVNTDNGCFISTVACPRMGLPDRFEISDFNIEAHTSQSMCAARAAAWYESCTKNDTLPVPRLTKTRFINTATSATPFETIKAHGCVITATYCPVIGYLAKTSWLSATPATHTDLSLCKSKAQQLADYCKTPVANTGTAADYSNLKVRAELFDKGVSKGFADSR